MGQGADLAQCIAAQCSHGIGYKHLSFSVHLCGCKPGWQHQIPHLFRTPISLPAFVAAGATDALDGDRADSGYGMAQLVHPKVAMRYVHNEGHRAFPSGRDDAAKQAESLVAFMMRAMSGGFPQPPLPPPSPPKTPSPTNKTSFDGGKAANGAGARSAATAAPSLAKATPSPHLPPSGLPHEGQSDATDGECDGEFAALVPPPVVRVPSDCRSPPQQAQAGSLPQPDLIDLNAMSDGRTSRPLGSDDVVHHSAWFTAW